MKITTILRRRPASRIVTLALTKTESELLSSAIGLHICAVQDATAPGSESRYLNRLHNIRLRLGKHRSVMRFSQKQLDSAAGCLQVNAPYLGSEAKTLLERLNRD